MAERRFHDRRRALHGVYNVWSRRFIVRASALRFPSVGVGADPRRNLLKQFHPLASLRRFCNGKTGSIAAWSREACDEAAADWIANNPENDGDGARFLEQNRG